MSAEKDQKVPDYINFLPKSAQDQYTEQATVENLSAEMRELRGSVRSLVEATHALLERQSAQPAQPVASGSDPSAMFGMIEGFTKAVTAIQMLRNTFVQEHNSVVAAVRDELASEEPESRDDKLLNVALETLLKGREQNFQTPTSGNTAQPPPSPITTPQEVEKMKISKDAVKGAIPEEVKKEIRSGSITQEEFLAGASREALSRGLQVEQPTLKEAYEEVRNDGQPSKLSNDSKPAKKTKPSKRSRGIP